MTRCKVFPRCVVFAVVNYHDNRGTAAWRAFYYEHRAQRGCNRLNQVRLHGHTIFISLRISTANIKAVIE
jgi:hypothetical protein